jgi:hypothetical protein
LDRSGNCTSVTEPELEDKHEPAPELLKLKSLFLQEESELLLEELELELELDKE